MSWQCSGLHLFTFLINTLLHFLLTWLYFYSCFGLIDRSIWNLFSPDFFLVGKVTVTPRTVFVGARLCHSMKGSTAESKFIVFIGVNWFFQQHLLYSWCKISHKEMAFWLCHFMGSALRELPRNSSCMQGTLLFLFRFLDSVTSHYCLLILLSVSQQRGLRSSPSIFTTLKLSEAQEDIYIDIFSVKYWSTGLKFGEHLGQDRNSNCMCS